MRTDTDGNKRYSIRLDEEGMDLKSSSIWDPLLQLMEVWKKKQNTIYMQVVNNLTAAFRVLCDKSAINVKKKIP